jgi:hypothetical protein
MTDQPTPAAGDADATHVGIPAVALAGRYRLGRQLGAGFEPIRGTDEFARVAARACQRVAEFRG